VTTETVPTVVQSKIIALCFFLLAPWTVWVMVPEWLRRLPPSLSTTTGAHFPLGAPYHAHNVSLILFLLATKFVLFRNQNKRRVPGTIRAWPGYSRCSLFGTNTEQKQLHPLEVVRPAALRDEGLYVQVYP
jgi:hypothetical protein